MLAIWQSGRISRFGASRADLGSVYVYDTDRWDLYAESETALEKGIVESGSTETLRNEYC
jgi:hypothetical protein